MELLHNQDGIEQFFLQDDHLKWDPITYVSSFMCRLAGRSVVRIKA